MDEEKNYFSKLNDYYVYDEEARSQLLNQASQLNSMQNNITTNKNNITALQTDNSTNKSNITTLQTDNSTNKANISNLQSRVTDLEISSGGGSSNQFSTLTGSFQLTNGTLQTDINYPAGYNSSNCFVAGVAFKNVANSNGFTTGFLPDARGYLAGALGHAVVLNDTAIRLIVCNPTEGSHTDGNASYSYKIILCKI